MDVNKIRDAGVDRAVKEISESSAENQGYACAAQSGTCMAGDQEPREQNANNQCGHGERHTDPTHARIGKKTKCNAGIAGVHDGKKIRNVRVAVPERRHRLDGVLCGAIHREDAQRDPDPICAAEGHALSGSRGSTAEDGFNDRQATLADSWELGAFAHVN